MNEFLKKHQFNERIIVTNKICNIKFIKGEVKVLIPYEIVLKSGLVSNTLIHLEELIITLNVKEIIYTNSYNHKIMNYLKDTYKISVKHLKIN